MNKFNKDNYIYLPQNYDKKDIEFQIIEWYNQDEEYDETSNDSNSQENVEICNEIYTIRAFGVTIEGISITCKINNFTPFYYIKVKDCFNKNQLVLLIDFIKTSYQLSKGKVNGELVSYSDCLIANKCAIIKKKDLYGFKNNKEFKFVRLVFSNYTALNKSKYIFKNPIVLNGINSKPMKYKLYESNFEPFMRFCHIKDILMAGWIKLPKDKYKKTYNTSNTQLELEIHYKDIISLKDKKNISNFLQASWDIETYSYDGTFPDPLLNIAGTFPNVIYQIATTFKYYNESNTLVKHLLTLKKCSKITSDDNIPIVVEECEDEQELITKWVDLIYNMDPDIMYTYNGDTFDCRYLFERSKIYGLETYLLSKLSRLSNVPTIRKLETFSSSAYGDSDFVRFYIPGRLNYDLLIHYKRGMKKYSSYKLDYISKEVLKVGKNEVTVKQIFEFYKNGNPDEIRKIAEYCIQDTELLQQLVDKQLILVTIIQLANVTFVPIGFLTTRGQTIKVFSQLLRKARQMNYLVPHTNFNEDSYPILIKSKIEHSLDLDNINEYIKIDCGKNMNTYGKLLQINGKITQIVDETTFIVLSNVELIYNEIFTAKYTFKNITYLINNLSNSDDLTDMSFTGATVLTASPGIYSENISVLDFASLYPTIMISRNLCYSSFIRDPAYLPKSQEIGIFQEKNQEGVLTTYERIKWDDKIEYTLKHNCCGIGKSGINKGKICGKQAYFDVTQRIELTDLTSELRSLNDEIELTSEIKKLKLKIRTKEKELTLFKNSINLFDNLSLDKSNYYCRIHDPLKTSRTPTEKFQKKDVQYDFVVVQPHSIDGIIVNQGVLPALLEDLYAERKSVKREMAKVYDSDKQLYGILDATQLGIKISLNSCYGFLGRAQGNLILKELGSIVTSVGRSLIEQSKDYAENHFNDYIKQHNLLTQVITHKMYDISKADKEIILEQFKLNID